MTLTKDGYRPRLIDSHIGFGLTAMGAVCVEGPRWCGKTWACLNQASSCFMVSESQFTLYSAKMDPSSTLNGDYPRLIDEWQDVPSIWDAVRTRVDSEARKGMFLLTGSSVPSYDRIMHSGAGRISVVRMHTMSLFESGDSSGSVSLKDIFDGKTVSVATEKTSLGQLIYLAIRGGWPGLIGAEEDAASHANRSYVDRFLRYDLSRVDDRRSISKMEAVMKSLARNESTLANDSTIIKDVTQFDDQSITESTLSVYMDVLDRALLLEPQQSFNPRYRSSMRVAKSVKRHFADPSLSVALMGLSREKMESNLNTFGFIFEAMCERDLRVYAEALGGSLYHYRDYKGNEIDAVVELPDGRWGAFEIKLGFNQVDDAADHLIRMKRKMESESERPPSLLCVIVGVSEFALRRPDGVYVVPITALRN